jgi:cytoskeletal protein CcmA (bactofilin family)
MLYPWSVSPKLAILLLLVFMLPGAGVARAETRLSDSVVVSQALDDDLYAMGGEVRIDGAVSGAVAVAAGSARIAGDVAGDVMVAGGRIDLGGGVGDDLRAAGGDIRVAGFVTDQATIAGGSVVIASGSAIGGRTWIAAGDVEMAGQIGGKLRVAAGKAVISGRVAGDVEVAAREIRVESGAVIGGDLVWRSGERPVIAEDARILGEVRAASSRDAPDFPGDSYDRVDGGWAFGITVVVAALILFWFAPQLVARSAAVFSAAPVRTVLLGAGAVVLMPILALVLFLTVLGWLLGLVVFAGYVFGVVLSGLVGLLMVAHLLRNRFSSAATGWRSQVVLAGVLIALVAAQQVPGVGPLLSVLLVLGGLGALTALATGRGPAGRGPSGSGYGTQAG